MGICLDPDSSDVTCLLGTGAALNKVLDQGQRAVLDEMLAEWPYFQTLIDMLEMVLSKADAHVALY